MDKDQLESLKKYTKKAQEILYPKESKSLPKIQKVVTRIAIRKYLRDTYPDKY